MTVPISPPNTSARAEEEFERPRLDFLDGIRGLAALYVAQYHIFQHPKTVFLNWMSYGHYAVGIFIVLSGYCLMLPVASSTNGMLRGGIGNYLKRRAWRIIPPYYVALALTLIQIAATQLIKHVPPKLGVESGWSVFAPANLLLHVTLLHNLSLQWSQTIDPPMWSVGLEWQIYFLFPLILLPLWRRSNAIATMAVVVFLSATPHLLLQSADKSDYIFPWFVGLFAMGMAGAAIGFSHRPQDTQWRHRLPWGTIAIVLSLILLIFVPRIDICIADLLVGLSIMCLLLYCSQSVVAGANPFVLRLLSSSPCVKLGQFSYSLYLMHLPAYWLIQPVLRVLHLHGSKEFLFQGIIGVPFAICVSYLFYRLFERNFISASARARSKLA